MGLVIIIILYIESKIGITICYRSGWLFSLAMSTGHKNPEPHKAEGRDQLFWFSLYILRSTPKEKWGP